MTPERTVVCVIGTRPEAIKMAPVVRALRSAPWARCVVVATAQHRGLLDQMLGRLQIPTQHDLDLMTLGQHPSELISRMLPVLDRVLITENANVVLAQGDTSTVFGAALCAFHRGIAFGHVEAGLRTGDLAHPFPEEGYRQMISRIAHWHFAPTERAADALKREGVPAARIHVTGNTCIDTLLHTLNQLAPPSPRSGRTILLTAHRRENFGGPLRSIFAAVRTIVDLFPDVRIVYPVHPNPSVQVPAHQLLSDHPRIALCAPLDYFEFVNLMRESTLVLTDSGGIQEEAPVLNKPVLVLRETTERQEAVEAGVARVVGTRTSDIVTAIAELLTDPAQFARMACGVSPYGDGAAASRIVEVLGRDPEDVLQPKGP